MTILHVSLTQIAGVRELVRLKELAVVSQQDISYSRR